MEILTFGLIALIKILVVIFVIILPMVSYTVLAERKVSAFIQDRIGPNRLGIHGVLQPVADALKFIVKEDFTPAHVKTFYYWLAPCLAMVPAMLSIAVVPFGSGFNLDFLLAPIGNFFNEPGWKYGPIGFAIADVNVGVLFVFAVASLGVYGIVLAGYASNSKYPFLGGIRSSSQMISYEIALGLSVIPIFLLQGDMNLIRLVEFQAKNGWLLLPLWGEGISDPVRLAMWIPLLISFVIFTIAIFAETNRVPFDLPEAETELVGGYHTEYSSMKFALFFLGEYAAMIVGSAIVVTLFLGGWSLPFGWSEPFLAAANDSSWYGVFMGILSIVIFIAKIALFLFFFMWVRWTLPRFRFDQLMKLGWIWLFEIALVNIFIAAFIIALLPQSA